MPRQLALDLPVRAALGRDDFLVSQANAAALARVDAWPDWPNRKLALIGPAGAGKTHLAHVWAESVGGQVLDAADIATLDLATLDRPVAVERLDTSHDDATETALFHLHNTLAERGLPFLMTGRDGPARWPVRLPDLKSRVSAADVARIEPPDDALLTGLLLKLFADRQIDVGLPLIDYLVARMERSFAAAQNTVARLDAAALERGRRVSRQLASEVLDLSD